jgi:cytochrome c6
MKRILTAVAALVSLALCAGGAVADTKKGEKFDGAKEFQEHCAVCHAGGGNIVNAKMTLHKKDREAHGVKTARDIIRLMRKPGPGMTKFDKKTISDREAKAIAEYILKEFK